MNWKKSIITSYPKVEMITTNSTYPVQVFQYIRSFSHPFITINTLFTIFSQNDCHQSSFTHSPLFLRPAEDAGGGPRHRAGSHQRSHHKGCCPRSHQAGLPALRCCFCLWRRTVCGRSHSRSTSTWTYCIQG